MRLKDNLGKGFWQAKFDGVSSSGMGEIWSNPDATYQELIGALPKHDAFGEPNYFYWSEWKKVGRKIEFVEIRRCTKELPNGCGLMNVAYPNPATN